MYCSMRRLLVGSIITFLASGSAFSATILSTDTLTTAPQNISLGIPLYFDVTLNRVDRFAKVTDLPRTIQATFAYTIGKKHAYRSCQARLLRIDGLKHLPLPIDLDVKSDTAEVVKLWSPCYRPDETTFNLPSGQELDIQQVRLQLHLDGSNGKRIELFLASPQWPAEYNGEINWPFDPPLGIGNSTDGMHLDDQAAPQCNAVS